MISFIVLSLDMRNAVSFYFLCVLCRFQCRFLNQDNQNARPPLAHDLSLQSLECVDFCIAPFSRPNILCDKKM